MAIKDSEIKKLFKDMMLHCRAERKAMSDSSLRQIAKEIGTTENYLSAVENGREYPSVPVLLRYLLVNGFDVTPLRTLKLKPTSQNADIKEKALLVEKIYSLDRKK